MCRAKDAALLHDLRQMVQQRRDEQYLVATAMRRRTAMPYNLKTRDGRISLRIYLYVLTAPCNANGSRTRKFVVIR